MGGPSDATLDGMSVQSDIDDVVSSAVMAHALSPGSVLAHPVVRNPARGSSGGLVKPVSGT